MKTAGRKNTWRGCSSEKKRKMRRGWAQAPPPWRRLAIPVPTRKAACLLIVFIIRTFLIYLYGRDKQIYQHSIHYTSRLENGTDC
ncbi:MAG: hypothetical protein ACJAQ8_000848 [Haliea salexigens]|jgi:hypothetical protein